jgi:hypothetical protein
MGGGILKEKISFLEGDRGWSNDLQKSSLCYRIRLLLIRYIKLCVEKCQSRFWGSLAVTRFPKKILEYYDRGEVP